MRIIKALIVIALLIPTVANAAKIRLPEEELAKESVLPVFDRAPVVMDRSVDLDGRINLGVSFGSALNEAFNSGTNYGGFLGYNFTDSHGLRFSYQMVPRNLTSYVKEQLDRPPFNLNLKNAPYLKSLMILDYQWISHYGKISLTKSFVMNLTTFLTLGVGFLELGDKSFPGLSLGLGQMYFFTKHIAFTFDLRIIPHKGPNVLADKVPHTLENSTQPVSSSAFKESLFYPIFLNGGLMILF